MEIEKLKKSNTKRYIITGSIVVLILAGITLTFTKAKYKTTTSIPLVNGTINYDLSDLNLIGVYIQEGEEYVKTDTIPTSGYEFNSEESYCTVNNEKDNNITLNFDMSTQNLTVTPLTTKGTKCYLYFDEKLSAGDTILAASKPQAQTTDWTGGTTYYYTGNPNNWVQFGTNSSGQSLYWRIIRINGDGTIRMIYQGTGFNTTGTSTQIGTSAFNSSSNRSYYVGLVHDGSSQHGSGQNSTIMNTLNNWYNSNLASYETDYIDTGAGFCSDRNLQSGSWSATGNHTYAAYGRLYNKGSESASLQCSDVDILSQDNGRLPNPIGLITADEAALAGVTWNNPKSSYLNTGQAYWTMSPYDYPYANVFLVWSNGNLLWYGVDNTSGVRPVINLKSAIAISGSGTTSDPFKIQ